MESETSNTGGALEPLPGLRGVFGETQSGRLRSQGFNILARYLGHSILHTPKGLIYVQRQLGVLLEACNSDQLFDARIGSLQSVPKNGVAAALHKSLEFNSKTLESGAGAHQPYKQFDRVADFDAACVRQDTFSPKANIEREASHELKVCSTFRNIQKATNESTLVGVSEVKFEFLPNEGQRKNVPSFRYE